jgi:hypothetical protein
LPVLATGLAFAGVALPGPAGSAFERIGIELPNQSESGTESPSGGAAEPAGGADDPASESAGGELSRERRNGANGREASRFGRCVAREARGGAKHPNRLCAQLKENRGPEPTSGDKGSAPGRPDSPGNSATAPGRTDKTAQGTGNAQGSGGDNGNSKDNGRVKRKPKGDGDTTSKGKAQGNGRTERDPRKGKRQEPNVETGGRR